MRKPFMILISAFGLVLTTAAQAPGGRIHAALEQRLSTLAPGEKLDVIVDLNDQVRPADIISGMRGTGRWDKAQAVVNVLRSVAEKRQGPILAHLKKQEQLGLAEHVKPFWIFNGLAVTGPESLIRELASRPDVKEVRLDARIPLPSLFRAASGGTASAVTEWNIETVRAPEVWAMNPTYNGTGVVIGSFDTGVDGTHPDLSSRFRGDNRTSWFDPYDEHRSPYDAHGHGTHTTGIAVGGDASGSNIGVAPGAVWIAAKGWNDGGTALTSAFHEIFQWFLAPGGDVNNAPDVVNCSWAFDEAGCDTEFLPDIGAWRAAGIFPAFAAGNDGPAPGSVRSPGAYPTAFAVGATDSSDAIAYFSGQGPTPCDGSVKPDISAPGDGIFSAIPGGYDVMSGTSMAAPHITGAVAVLRSIDPSLTVDELESILTFGAVDLGDQGPDTVFGAGRLDLYVAAQIAILGPETPVVRVVATDALATEAGPTSGLFMISRTGSTASDLEVHFSVGGTASEGSDYASIGVRVTIPAGQTSAEIPVTAIDDLLAELSETVILAISPDPAYIVSGSGSAVVTIQSDELLCDLAVSALTVPTAGAGGGDSIVLAETTKNQGAGAAEPSTTQFYLSANSVYDGTDILLGGRSVVGLAAGASSSGSTTVTIPQGVAAGTWYIIAKADGIEALFETSENNNTLAKSIKIGPDLDVSAMTVPTTGGAGLAIAVSDTVKNLGGGAAAASRTNFYLSTNTTLDASDTLLGGRDVGVLAAGASSSGSATVTIPDGSATGSWFIIAKADGNAVVDETSETNNTDWRSIKIGPDLIVSSFTVPATGGAGQTISVTDTTKNQGGGTATATRTLIYLSTNTTLDASDSLLGARGVGSLAAGGSDSGTAKVTIPSGTVPGTWYIIAKADGDEAVPETAETNNISPKTIRVGPDLAVFALTVPTTAGAGQTISVTDTTKNQGGGAAPVSRTQLFLSSDSILGTADILLGARSVAGLAAGASSSGSTLVVIPAGTAAGTWYIIAEADGEEVVPETSESNNTLGKSIKIGPDLIVTAITVPATTGAGQAITVTDTTKNQGGGAAPASRTLIYLSTKTTLDASATLLGARIVGGLAVGTSSSGAVTVTIPPATATGTWYVFAKADGDDAIPETTESNNTNRNTVKIGPDLTVSALSAPTTAGAGQTITITDTVKNAGGGAADASRSYFYLSTNSVLDASDILLGARDVAGLAAGASSSGSAAVVIPSGTAAGSWYLIAKTDGAGTVAETTETNNTSSRSLKIS